jgi:hypothetical protein
VRQRRKKEGKLAGSNKERKGKQKGRKKVQKERLPPSHFLGT